MALSKLESLVNKLEDGGHDLEQTINDFEEGMKLAQLCEKKLTEARGRVEKILKKFGGEQTVAPFSPEEDNDS